MPGSLFFYKNGIQARVAGDTYPNFSVFQQEDISETRIPFYF